eukprot:m.80173 g.80173  ORF g.80173 m.80173 type:complete len:336 (+) comp10881_c0_seq1:275-1282(+)
MERGAEAVSAYPQTHHPQGPHAPARAESQPMHHGQGGAHLTYGGQVTQLDHTHTSQPSQRQLGHAPPLMSGMPMDQYAQYQKGQIAYGAPFQSSACVIPSAMPHGYVLPDGVSAPVQVTAAEHVPEQLNPSQAHSSGPASSQYAVTAAPAVSADGTKPHIVSATEAATSNQPWWFVCDLCDFHTKRRREFIAHDGIHDNVRQPGSVIDDPLACDHCDYRAPDLDIIELHLATHSKKKPFMCNVCGREYFRLASVNKHKATHTTVLPFSCDLCGRSFANELGLRSHVLSHSGDDKPYQCRVCGCKSTHCPCRVLSFEWPHMLLQIDREKRANLRST